MKDIKLRIRSVESTRQITKAMQLVATSKLRRAKERMENSKPYATVSREAVMAAVRSCAQQDTPFVAARPDGRRCYVIIAGERELVAALPETYDEIVEVRDGAGGQEYDLRHGVRLPVSVIAALCQTGILCGKDGEGLAFQGGGFGLGGRLGWLCLLGRLLRGVICWLAAGCQTQQQENGRQQGQDAFHGITPLQAGKLSPCPWRLRWP